MRFALLGASCAVGLSSRPAAFAQQPVKIGFITTLSGPGGYIGADARDGFQLAVEMEGGKLGGVPVQVVVEDDGLKPGTGQADRRPLLKTDGIKLFTGIIFSNVLRRHRARHSRCRRHLCQPERGPLELRRQGLPQELFRGVLAERHAA